MAAISVTVYEPQVPVQTADGDSPSASGVWIPPVAHVVGRPDKISSEVLRGSLSEFLGNFGQALSGVPAALAGYHVEQIELSLEISTTGAVRLIIGSPAFVDRAAMKLTLIRK